MDLKQHIEDIRIGIRSGRFTNEASVSQGIVLRILSALSWPYYDTQIVWPEYSLAVGRVNYALCDHSGKPKVFLEVKQIGKGEGTERQLFEYAFHVGVPLAVLTDGREWNFFLPGEQGDYGERRVYKLDIVERDISECVTRLNRYLNYNDVLSGKAIEAAREDYRNVSRNRQIHNTLPKALAKLVKEEDDLLLELVADQVENLCGYKPDLDIVARFLKERVRIIDRPTTEPLPPILPEGCPKGFSGFRFKGRDYRISKAKDVLIQVFEVLSEHDPTFPARFAALPMHGHKRRYLARTKQELYPDRPDLCDLSVRLKSGWFLGTNYGRYEIKKIIRMACQVAKIKYGQDLIVCLDD